MAGDPERFLERWQERVGPLLDEALEFLAGQEAPPFPDGVLGDWVDQLRTMPFGERHAGPLIALIDKDDPFLQEAGLRLAAPAAARIDGLGERLEIPLARLLEREAIDPWVLRAVVRLLGCFIGPEDPPLTAVYRELVRVLEEPAPEAGEVPPEQEAREGEGSEQEARPAIMRNMFINPRREAIELFEQIALQSLHPGERERALLPVLEERHGARGWRETVVCLLERMGIDPDDHFAILDG